MLEEKNIPVQNPPEKEKPKEEAVQNASPYPPGFGMSIDAVIDMFMKMHATRVDKTDPILMMVTLHNAFLFEQQKLFDRHNQAMTKVLSERSAHYMEEVKKASHELSENVTRISTSAFVEMLNKHAQVLGHLQQSLWWPASIAILSALVNVAALLILHR